LTNRLKLAIKRIFICHKKFVNCHLSFIHILGRIFASNAIAQGATNELMGKTLAVSV
jgi:hypothetical protein